MRRGRAAGSRFDAEAPRDSRLYLEAVELLPSVPRGPGVAGARLVGRRLRLGLIGTSVGSSASGSAISPALASRSASAPARAPASLGDLGQSHVGVERRLSSLGAHRAQPRLFELGGELLPAGGALPHLLELLALEQPEALLRSQALGALDLELGGEGVALGAQALDLELQLGRERSPMVVATERRKRRWKRRPALPAAARGVPGAASRSAWGLAPVEKNRSP